jgi:hypothetical protein
VNKKDESRLQVETRVDFSSTQFLKLSAAASWRSSCLSEAIKAPQLKETATVKSTEWMIKNTKAVGSGE